jgi:hypothetical protein
MEVIVQAGWAEAAWAAHGEDSHPGTFHVHGVVVQGQEVPEKLRVAISYAVYIILLLQAFVRANMNRVFFVQWKKCSDINKNEKLVFKDSKQEAFWGTPFSPHGNPFENSEAVLRIDGELVPESLDNFETDKPALGVDTRVENCLPFISRPKLKCVVQHFMVSTLGTILLNLHVWARVLNERLRKMKRRHWVKKLTKVPFSLSSICTFGFWKAYCRLRVVTFTPKNSANEQLCEP